MNGHCRLGIAIGVAATSLAVLFFKKKKDIIKHYGLPNVRASSMVRHGNTLYLSGQVPDVTKLEQSDIKEQTRQTLAKIDNLLAEAGTTKSNILSSQIWGRSMKDFPAMNEVWNEWVGGEDAQKGVRACVESNMAREACLVEIKVIASI